MTHPSDPTPIDTVHAFVGDPSILAVGAEGGPLAGATLAVKDVLDVAGTVTGAGNPTFASGRSPADHHAEAVERLVAAGATVIGKTITDELAYSLSGTNVHLGTPINPAAPDRVPGGSSAGSAAAVAAGLADLALGTDTGGSIRVPASYGGIVGWRPTHGAVGVRGVVALAPSFDTVGLLARDLGLLAAAADVLLPEPITEADLGPAVLVEELLAGAAPAAAAATHAASHQWTGGAQVALGVDLAGAADTFRTLQGAEAWTEHGAWITRVRPAMGPGIAQRFEVASRVTAAQVEAAQPRRDEIRAVVEQATARGRVLIGPAAPGAAPRRERDLAPATSRAAVRAATLELTCLAGLAGAPVVVLPLASIDGAPLGVACLSAPGTDRALLGWAAERFGR